VNDKNDCLENENNIEEEKKSKEEELVDKGFANLPNQTPIEKNVPELSLPIVSNPQELEANPKKKPEEKYYPYQALEELLKFHESKKISPSNKSVYNEKADDLAAKPEVFKKKYFPLMKPEKCYKSYLKGNNQETKI